MSLTPGVPGDVRLLLAAIAVSTILVTIVAPYRAYLPRRRCVKSKGSSVMIEIELSIADGQVCVSARGNRGERPEPFTLPGEITLERLDAFAEKVCAASRRRRQLEASLIEEARALHDAFFQGALRDLMTRTEELGKATNARPLLQLMLRDRRLQRIPWEALCRPGMTEEFLGSGVRWLIARSVRSSEPLEARQVEGAVRVLMVAPSGAGDVKMLETALQGSCVAGEVEWLEPVTGPRATRRHLYDYLRTGLKPHILHFIGHGGIDGEGDPVLKLAADEDEEDDDKETWIKVKLLASELRASLGGDLRLLVLEACEAAKPGSPASAAEMILEHSGAHAVVAHLWPIKADVARTCSRAFYRALTGAGNERGNVVASLSAARRTLLLESAEAFSPVVYLRGDQPMLFDFAATSKDARWNDQLDQQMALAPPARALVAPSPDDAPDPTEIEVCLAEAHATLARLTVLRPGAPMPAWLERPELETLLAATSRSSRPIVLLGGPGTGKSNLLSRLASALHEGGSAVLAIRAEQLGQEIDSLEKLQRELGLSRSPARVLRTLVRSRRTVLLIDQLDALCDLMDAHTRRLDVLLKLVREARAIAGVTVILSSREFEMRHDARFRDFDAEEVQLAPIDPKVIGEVLSQRGVGSRSVAPAMLEMLGAPQCLHIFLTLLDEEHPASELDTYARMLELLWQKRVIGKDGSSDRERVLLEIVARMAHHEELHAPRALFNHETATVNQLQAAGILRVADPRRIELTHQTWFAFARARTFLTGKERLVDFVRNKGGSLFVRATLWSALVNLREADRSLYHQELRALWGTPDLRMHLRALLIEHIGRASDPTDVDAGLLIPEIRGNGSLRRLALYAIAGKPGWFRRLSDRHLPVLMDREDGLDLFGVLSLAWPVERERVLALLERHWAHKPERASWSLAVLSRLTEWDERAVELAIAALRKAPAKRSGLGSNSVLFHAVSEHAPDLAARVARAVLEQRMASAERPSLPYSSIDWKLEGGSDLYGLAKIGQQAPDSILEHIWPWFVGVLAEPSAGDRERSRYPHVWTSHTFRRHARRPPSELFESIKNAIVSLGQRDPDRMEKFVQRWSGVEADLAHELIVLGLIEIAPLRPSAAVDYLLGDTRRLLLGDASEQTGTTRALLRALAPHASAAHIRDLEEMLGRSALYQEKADGVQLDHKLWRSRNNRAHRMRLLQALETSKHLSARARHLIGQERVQLGDMKDESIEIGEAQVITSPMSAQQMARASVAAIVHFHEELPDSTDWRHPRWPMKGGAIEASGELAVLAKTMPEKALKVISHLQPEHNEMPVGHVLGKIAESDTSLSAGEIERIILEYDARGFSSQQYRWHVAWGLTRLSERSKGLSDEICSMLNRWLEQSPAAAQDEADEPEDAGELKSSLLWSPGGGGTLPDGNYPTLNAILDGYCRRDHPATEAWFAVLRSHLERGDRTKVWRALLRHLIHLARDPQMHAITIDLFRKAPRVLCSWDGVFFAAHLSRHAPEDALKSWLDALRGSDWPRASQAYGELIGIILMNRTDIGWAAMDVDVLLSAGDSSPQIVDAMRGLAFAAAHIWWWPEGLQVCTPLLIALAGSGDASVRAAAMEVFRPHEPMPASEHTERLLDALCKSPQAVRDADAATLIWHLRRICDDEPARTVRLCNILLGMDGAAVRESGIGIASEDLINISLTLQRKEDHREDGLVMFERLLELGLYGIQDVLREVDTRTVFIGPFGERQ